MSCQVTALPLSLPAWLSTFPEEKDQYQCDREGRVEIPDSMSYQLLALNLSRSQESLLPGLWREKDRRRRSCAFCLKLGKTGLVAFGPPRVSLYMFAPRLYPMFARFPACCGVFSIFLARL